MMRIDTPATATYASLDPTESRRVSIPIPVYLQSAIGIERAVESRVEPEVENLDDDQEAEERPDDPCQDAPKPGGHGRERAR